MKRLFFALELSDEVRDGLEQLRTRLQHHLPDAHWVRPELMHVTVKFLGNTPDDQVGDVIEAGLAAVEGAGVCRLEAAGLGAFPGARRPRVVWVGLRGDLSPLARVVQHLETALEGLGFPKERREFSPHITLARARRGGRRRCSVKWPRPGFLWASCWPWWPARRLPWPPRPASSARYTTSTKRWSTQFPK